MRANRTAARWVLALGLVALATSACGRGAGVVASTTTAPTAALTTTAAPTTTAVRSRALPCRTIKLSVALGKGNGTAGSVYVPLLFRNRGSSACTLYGYPGVS